MALVKVPPGVSSVTVTGEGARVPDASQNITVASALNATELVKDQFRPRIQNTSSPTQVIVQLPPIITSITVNGNVYAVTAGVSAAMLAADANALVRDTPFRFKIVIG